MERRIITEFFSRSTWHGIADIFENRRNRCMCIFWTISMLLAFRFCVYCCYRIVDQYLKATSAISFSYVTDSIMRGGSSNDARKYSVKLYLCPLVRFNQTKVSEMNISRALLDFIDLKFYLGNRYKLRNSANAANNSRALHMFLAQRDNMTFNDLMNKISHDELYVFDSDESYFYSILTGYGKCYLGFISKPVTVLKLKVPKPWDNLSSTIRYEGIKLLAYAGHATNLPTANTVLLHGQGTVIEIEPTCYNMHPRLNSRPNCKNNIVEDRCVANCVIELDHTCVCNPILTIIRTNRTQCDPYQMVECKKAMIRYHGGLATYRNKIKTCMVDCMPCSYCKLHLTTTSFRHNRLVRKNRENIEVTITLIGDYKIINEIPSKSWEEFIADIGGQLGLWIGGSILSVLQLVVFMFRYCTLKIRRQREEYQSEI